MWLLPRDAWSFCQGSMAWMPAYRLLRSVWFREPVIFPVLTVQPLPHVGKGPTVIAVTAAVAVAVAGFDSVKAFQRNNALRNQGHSAGRVARVSLIGDFPDDRLTVVKRACVLDKCADGKRTQSFRHCFSLSLNRF